MFSLNNADININCKTSLKIQTDASERQIIHLLSFFKNSLIIQTFQKLNRSCFDIV